MITVRFTTRKPDVITEIFHIRIGHFEPVEFKITAEGIYSLVSFGGVGVVKSPKF